MGPVCGRGAMKAAGFPVLISNGLGTPHDAWPWISTGGPKPIEL